MDTMNVGGETGCRCFKLDNTTSLSVIINDKHLALRARCFSVNNHFKFGYYPIHKQ